MEQLAVKGNLARSADSWYLHLFATPLVFGVGPTLVWKDNASTWRLAAGALAVVLFAVCLLLGIFRSRGRPGWGLLLAWLLVPVALPALVSSAGQPGVQHPLCHPGLDPVLPVRGRRPGQSAGQVAGLQPGGRRAGDAAVTGVLFRRAHQAPVARGRRLPGIAPASRAICWCSTPATTKLAYAHYVRPGPVPSLRLRLSDPPAEDAAWAYVRCRRSRGRRWSIRRPRCSATRGCGWCWLIPGRNRSRATAPSSTPPAGHRDKPSP